MIGNILFTTCLFLIVCVAIRFMLAVAFPKPVKIKASRPALD